MREFILEGNISLNNAFQIKQQLLDLIKEEPEGLVINFQKVENIDSTGLGILVSVLKKVNQRKLKLRLTKLNSAVQEVFQLTMLDTIFETD